MNRLDVVRCVNCPLLKGDYISIPNCYKCPHFVSHEGLTINCGYEVKEKYILEPDIDKEYRKTW